jgi:hypothetical protein
MINHVVVVVVVVVMNTTGALTNRHDDDNDLENNIRWHTCSIGMFVCFVRLYHMIHWPTTTNEKSHWFLLYLLLDRLSCSSVSTCKRTGGDRATSLDSCVADCFVVEKVNVGRLLT